MEKVINFKDKKYIEKISNQYKDNEVSKLNELRRLDSKAKIGAKIFGYSFGVVTSLILGFGMCVAMEVILEEYMWLGIGIGLLGLVLVSINYPIYKLILKKGKKKYSQQILHLSNELLNE